MLRLSDEECAALLNVLWEHSITGLALVDEDGTFRRVNPAFSRLTEYNEAELKRMRFQDITDPADVRADEEMAAQVARGEFETYEMSKAYLTKTKRVQPVLLRVTALRIGGRFTYFVGEVAPLDSPPAERALVADVQSKVARKLLWTAIRENWQVLAAVGGGLAVIIAQVIEKLR